MSDTIELCRSCDQPFCAECSEDAVQCADGGWHCAECGWRGCPACVADEAREFRAEQKADIDLHGAI